VAVKRTVETQGIPEFDPEEEDNEDKDAMQPAEGDHHYRATSLIRNRTPP